MPVQCCIADRWSYNHRMITTRAGMSEGATAAPSAPPGASASSASTSGSSASDPQHQRATLATITPSPAQIKAARTLARQSQDEAAQLVHVTGRAWRRWESGEREISGAAWELYLIKALGFTPIK